MAFHKHNQIFQKKHYSSIFSCKIWHWVNEESSTFTLCCNWISKLQSYLFNSWNYWKFFFKIAFISFKAWKHNVQTDFTARLSRFHCAILFAAIFLFVPKIIEKVALVCYGDVLGFNFMCVGSKVLHLNTAVCSRASGDKTIFAVH